MPVTIQYQTFSASVPTGGHDWGSNNPDNIAPQIDTVLKSWITTCNANSNNATKQITILRDINNAIAPATSRGWVLRTNITSTIGLIVSFQAKTTANSYDAYDYRILNGTTGNFGWSDTASNNGYGTFNSTLGSAFTDTAWFAYSSKGGSSKDYIIAYSTDNAQEFFTLNWKLGGTDTSWMAGFIIFKDNNNNWMSVATNSSGTTYTVATISNNFYTPCNAFIPNIFTNSRLYRPIFTPTVTSGIIPGTGVSVDIAVNGANIPDSNLLVAHPNVFFTDSNTTRFNFGGELTVNSRIFYGIHRYYWVVES